MKSFLIIEDNPENRELLAEIFRQQARCDFASTGREAILIYNQAIKKKKPYDLILLDLEIPELSGLEILAIIRDSESKAGILWGDGVPIVVVTGHRPQFLDAFDKGCDDYILKPIDSALLMSKVTQLLRKRPRQS